MTDATITYDYPVIEECLSMMSRKATEIEGQTNELESDVKRIMIEWKGDTANRYDERSNGLRNELHGHRDNLNNLNVALRNAAEAMKAQDSRGASSI
ncbi:WXG100 family type VII secretion target [Amycolatopsis sp. EV170708-02-1]|uniref:WXG100 family type VII secretion target n=1 Tax=Amycolatopsis sp. EV170708-02-1 TaxID=2919322 RepID=UPI001F0BF1A7|nr:WXG100 family type VII secretion target [Amycolatopsis sp. EV170708-02-1]UMP06955.1 WXG100 family type VII secretion target [Amycolatopsis sp. EV170708-02-1]